MVPGRLPKNLIELIRWCKLVIFTDYYSAAAKNGDNCAGIRVGDQLELQPGAGPQLHQEQPGAGRTVQGGGANIY
jgi:hypothetical protein